MQDRGRRHSNTPGTHGKRTASRLYLAVGSLSVLLAAASGTSWGAEPVEPSAPAKKSVDFERDILPILSSRCDDCHGPEAQEGGFRLDVRASLLRGGDSGMPAIIPGDSGESRLIRRVAGLEPDLVMPPIGERLTAEQISLLRAWIDQGAKMPASPDDPREGSPKPATDPSQPHGALPLPAPAKKSVDFERDILPILSSRCYICHGPETQESGLRLDVRADMLRGGDSGAPAIIPGNSGESRLIRLAAGLQPGLVMPLFGKRLTAEQISLLRAWIDQGAKMPASPDGFQGTPTLTTDFWSLQPLGDQQPPTGDDPWGRGPIDAFVLAKLNKAGLRPSPPADRDALIRRLYLDVLGLPPTPKEVAAFVQDTRPDAYARLVDRVLASPHYGERWAQHWLDVIGYAETHGFEMNQERPNAYHYRDYLIRAFNTDKPYDRFIFEQLAGDAVGTDAATGFLVSGAWDQVKSPNQALTLMQRQNELDGMVIRTSTAFLGLTVGCARCHNHRFDPILQKDYYSMQAVFAGVQHGARPFSGSDHQESQRRLADIRQAIAAVEAQVVELGPRPPVNALRNVERFEPVVASAVRYTVLATNTKTQPCLDELEVHAVAEAGEAPRNVALASAGARATASGTLSGSAIHRLEHVNDGRYGNQHSWISDASGRGWVVIELARPTRINRIVWGRDRTGKYTDRLATEYRIEVLTGNEDWRLVASSDDRLPGDGAKELVSGSGSTMGLASPSAERVRELLARLRSLKDQHEKLLAERPTVYAGRFVQPEPTHLLYRGNPIAPREIVAPDTLTVLDRLGMDPEAPEQQRRIALAHSIASPENPLTARVMVNRLWQYHFGRGIVATPSDFGAIGARPTHPRLLDWLAGELIRGDWSLKHIHRLILLSATFRQADTPREQALAVDAQARWLWRFPPRRLDAEVIHDSILAVSGVLDLQMRGPGFSAFEPNDNYVRVYRPKEQFGQTEWRRMIYMTKVRSVKPPIFGAFDCPTGAQVMPKRGRSTTPIQALNLFNSGFVVEQSELFAERLEREAGRETADQVRRAFRLAFGRAPDQVELAAAVKLVDAHGLQALCRAIFNSNEFLFLP